MYMLKHQQYIYTYYYTDKYVYIPIDCYINFWFTPALSFLLNAFKLSCGIACDISYGIITWYTFPSPPLSFLYSFWCCGLNPGSLLGCSIGWTTSKRISHFNQRGTILQNDASQSLQLFSISSFTIENIRQLLLAFIFLESNSLHTQRIISASGLSTGAMISKSVTSNLFYTAMHIRFFYSCLS